MMEWFRVYHGMVSDDKWSLIARKSGQPRAFVVAVWAMLLEIASQNEDRGSVEAFDPEVADALFDMPDGAAQAIYDALCSGKNPRIADGCILSWEKRQPQRERDDHGSAERVRRYRDRKRLETAGNASETPACNDVTPCNAPRTEKNREEKKEERKTDASHLAPSDAGASSAHPPAERERPVAFIPLADGTEFAVLESLAREYRMAYPGVDVAGELGKARAWCLSNPRKRKTRNGIRRFLNGWMDKAQNNASRASPASFGPPLTARQAEAKERGDWAKHILAFDEAVRNGDVEDFGFGTEQGVCALSAADAGAGRV
ncbi:hypothetical protein [uncultured Bilophila sp.]|nr:hypothetical protein [uncultured Bilophila sp.]